MKLLLPIALTLLSIPSARAQYTQIDFNWSYSPNLNTCVQGTTFKSCWSGFKMWDELSKSDVPLTTLPTSARSYTLINPSGIVLGTHVFDLVAFGYDVNGSYFQSSAAKLTLNVTPPPAKPASFMLAPH